MSSSDSYYSFNHTFFSRSTLFSLITSLLKEKTVIQMQLYGIGKFDQKHSNGAFQLAVALNLFARFKEMFSETTVTFQDPIMAPAEAEYLHLKGVRIIHGNSFTSNHFIQASTTAAIPGPAFICYMIHSDWEVFDEFLAAHWDSQLLSRIIFVGNELRSLDSHPKFHSISPRIKEFSKLCDSKSFKCEKDTVASAAFHLTDVFVISQKNAEFLVNLFK